MLTIEWPPTYPLLSVQFKKDPLDYHMILKLDFKIFRRKSMIVQKQAEDEEMKNDPAYMLFMEAEKTTDDLMSAPTLPDAGSRRGSIARRRSLIPDLEDT